MTTKTRAEGKQGGVTCTRCNDTHEMQLNDMTVMCTQCPVPCQDCQFRGTGAFCAATPCGCKCHALDKLAEANERMARSCMDDIGEAQKIIAALPTCGLTIDLAERLVYLVHSVAASVSVHQDIITTQAAEVESLRANQRRDDNHAGTVDRARDAEVVRLKVLLREAVDIAIMSLDYREGIATGRSARLTAIFHEAGL